MPIAKPRKIYKNKIPTHVGFIIDGNGRWAKERGLTRSMGHKAGFKTLKKTTKECFFKYNIKHVSVYAFSTENWNRPKKEVDYLMNICYTINSECYKSHVACFDITTWQVLFIRRLL